MLIQADDYRFLFVRSNEPDNFGKKQRDLISGSGNLNTVLCE